VVILDSQSAKTTERGGVRGFDGHKRIKGRKRHLLVDTLWWKPPTSRIGAQGARSLAGLRSGFTRIRTVIADGGYESQKLARCLKRRYGCWRLRIIKHPQHAFKVTGLSWNAHLRGS
jgi:DDE family transposase